MSLVNIQNQHHKHEESGTKAFHQTIGLHIVKYMGFNQYDYHTFHLEESE